MKRLLHPIDMSDLGIVGTRAPNNFAVGDIVCITKTTEDIQYAVIVCRDGVFYPFGWRGATFDYLINEKKMALVNNHEEISDVLLWKCKYKPYILEGGE